MIAHALIAHVLALFALLAASAATGQDVTGQDVTGQGVTGQDVAPLTKIVTLQAADGDVTRRFFGRVEARETVDLAFQVGGRIAEIPAVEGEVIAKGALIARLDPEPFEIARDQALVRKAQADRALRRLSLLSRNAVAAATVDDARTEVALAHIALRDAERALRETALIAPFDALVATRRAAKFATVAAGAPIVRLHDMSDLRIGIDVPEVLFQRAGRDPDVTLEARFPGLDRGFPLAFREFNAETSTIGQTFRLTLGMAPPDDVVILPGASATVFATMHGRGVGMSAPASGIVLDSAGGTGVMLFTPAQDNPNRGVVTRKEVRIRASRDGEVLIIDGVAPGAEIVATGGGRLEEGQSVRRFTGFAN